MRRFLLPASVTLAAAALLALLAFGVAGQGADNSIDAQLARGVRPDLKVLFTTGYARNAIVHHGLLDADVELLPKPFTVETLGRKIRQVLYR